MMGKRLVGFFVVLAVLLASVAAPLFQPSAVLATAPTTPTNVSPSSGATGVGLTPTLQATAFFDLDLDGPAASEWVIGGYTFTKNVADGSITEYAVPAGYLTYGQTYSWQVRYRDTNSEWSDCVHLDLLHHRGGPAGGLHCLADVRERWSQHLLHQHLLRGLRLSEPPVEFRGRGDQHQRGPFPFV